MILIFFSRANAQTRALHTHTFLTHLQWLGDYLEIFFVIIQRQRQFLLLTIKLRYHQISKLCKAESKQKLKEKERNCVLYLKSRTFYLKKLFRRIKQHITKREHFSIIVILLLSRLVKELMDKQLFDKVYRLAYETKCLNE